MTRKSNFLSFLTCCVSSSAPVQSSPTTDQRNESEGPSQSKTQNITSQPGLWLQDSYEKLRHRNAQLEKELNEARQTIQQHEERLLVYSKLRLSNICTPLKFNTNAMNNECSFHGQSVPSLRTDLSYFPGPHRSRQQQPHMQLRNRTYRMPSQGAGIISSGENDIDGEDYHDRIRMTVVARGSVEGESPSNVTLHTV